MHIIEYPLTLDENITHLLLNTYFLNFSQYKELSIHDLLKIFQVELNILKKTNYDPKMYLLMHDDQPSGLITIENLEWDTPIIGINMGRFIHCYLNDKIKIDNGAKSTLIDHALKEFRKREITHISIKADVNNWSLVKLLQSMGFILMDTLLDFSFNLSKGEVGNFETDLKIRYMEEGDREKVMMLCREVYETFRYDRFHRESLFQKERSTNLYEEWMRNQIEKDAEEITVAEKDGEIVGFSTLEFYNHMSKEISVKFANIPISGVSEAMRGKSVFPAMMRNNLLYAKGKDIDIIKTTTHVNNFAIQKSLISMGFKPSSARHTFHKILF